MVPPSAFLVNPTFLPILQTNPPSSVVSGYVSVLGNHPSLVLSHASDTSLLILNHAHMFSCTTTRIVRLFRRLIMTDLFPYSSDTAIISPSVKVLRRKCHSIYRVKPTYMDSNPTVDDDDISSLPPAPVYTETDHLSSRSLLSFSTSTQTTQRQSPPSTSAVLFDTTPAPTLLITTHTSPTDHAQPDLPQPLFPISTITLPAPGQSATAHTIYTSTQLSPSSTQSFPD